MSKWVFTIACYVYVLSAAIDAINGDHNRAMMGVIAAGVMLLLAERRGGA